MKTLNLVIDIGNTLTKIALFKDDEIFELSSVYSSYGEQIIETANRMKQSHAVKASIISSVSNNDHAIVDFFRNNFKKSIDFTQSTPVPIINLYGSPETLGKDRLAGVVAANSLFKNQNVLVFDAGTALTIDFINASGEYLGGNISPGLEMRFNALNRYTKNLPLLSADKETNNLFGRSTRTAIINGVQNGILYEIKEYILRFRKKYPDLKIIFTGGDTFFFENRIKNKIFADPNLVLKGLNIILNYNE